VQVVRQTLMGGVVLRTVYGVLALGAPRLMFRSAGQSEPDPNVRYFNALFGGRDIVVAGWTVAALRQGREREALAANIGCELGDSIALVQELRVRGGLDLFTGVGLAFNLLGWASWTRAAAALRR
jgi:hypothetical protein